MYRHKNVCVRKCSCETFSREILKYFKKQIHKKFYWMHFLLCFGKRQWGKICGVKESGVTHCTACKARFLSPLTTT